MSLAFIRHRWAGFLGTFAALLVGVAVIAGCLTLWAAAQPRVPDTLAAADALVVSPKIEPADGGFPVYRPWSPDEVAALVARLSATPGVRAAVPVRTFYVQRLVDGQPVGDPTDAVHSGHAWSSAGLGGYTIRNGNPPRGPGQVVVPSSAGVPVGAALPVLTASGPTTWTVTGVSDAPGLFVDDATASALAGGVRVIGVLGDRVTLDAGPLGTVLTGDARAAAESERDTRTRWLGAQLIIATVFVGGFVAVFVVSSTCAFAVTSRRRELGLLRAVGATPGQVRRLLLTEIVLLGLLAGVPGALLGGLAAPLLAGPFVAVGLEPAGFTVGVSWWALGVSVLVGLVVGAAGVWLSARRAGRVSPLDALRDAAVERRPMTRTRWATGGLGVLAGGGLALLLPGATAQDKPTIVLGSAMLFLVAAALLAPVLVVPLVRLLPPGLFGRGATGVLVRGAAAVSARRFASVAAPVLAAVGFAVLLVGTFQTAAAAVGVEHAAAIPAVSVAAGSPAVPGLSEAAVRAQPGSAPLPTVVYLPSGSLDAVGVPGFVGFAAPAELGFRVGQEVPLRFADGTVVTQTVTAHSSVLLTLPRDLVRRHDPTALTPKVHLSGAFVPSPGASVMTARAYVEREASSENDLVNLFLAVLLGISVGYTALSVANTVLMATYSRRQELVTLHRTGATVAQTARFVVVESLLAVVLGVALGLAVAVPALFEARAGLQDEIGAPVTLVMPWSTLAFVAGVCALLAAFAAALPFLRRGVLSVGARTMAG